MADTTVFRYSHETLRAFLSCALGCLYCLFVLSIDTGVREDQIRARLAIQFGLIPIVLIAIYSMYLRRQWQVYLLSAFTIALTAAIIGTIAIDQEALETGVNRGGYEVILFGFVPSIVLSFFAICAFHVIIRLLLGKPRKED